MTNGNDLVSAYCRESGRFALPLVELALTMADVGDRPQKYEQSQNGFFLNVVWQVIKAWFIKGGKADVKKD